MPDTMISGYSDGAPPASGDAFVFARSGNTFKVTWDEIVAKINTRFYDITGPAYGATVYSSVSAAASGTDATTAVNNAITDASNAGGGMVVIPGWARISGQITFKSNVTIAGIGRSCSGFVFDQSVSSVGIDAAGSAGSTLHPAADINIGDRSTTISSSGLSAGDWVYMWDNTASSWGGWVTRVAAVHSGSPDTITFFERCPNFLTTSANIASFIPVENIGMRDLSVTNATEDPGDNTSRTHGWINFAQCIGVKMTNVGVNGGSGDSTGWVVGGQQCRDVEVRDCHFFQNGDASLTDGSQTTRNMEFRYSTGISVSGCHTERTGGSAWLSFTGCSHFTVGHNIVGGASGYLQANNDLPDSAVYTTLDGAQTLPLATITVIDTTGFPASGSFFVDGFEIQYTGTTSTTFTGCSGGSGTIASGSIVSYPNLPTDQGGRGIKLIYGCTHFTISDNIIHDTGFDAIHVVGSSFGSVRGNTCFAAHDVPINVQDDGAGPVCHHVHSIGNIINYHQNAQYTPPGFQYTTVTHSIISNNSVSNTSADADAAIYLDSTCTDCVVSGNIIYNSGSYGIQLNTGCTRNIVSNNIIRSSSGNSINSQNSAGGNYIWGNVCDLSLAVNSGASPADSLDMVAGGSTTSPGQNVVV